MLKRAAHSLLYRTTGRVLVNPTPKFDGAHSRHWWATRDDNFLTAPGYWESRKHPARFQIAKALANLRAASLLEIGCHSGANLWAAAQLQEWDKLAGTEISNTVLDFTKTTLPQTLGRKVELVSASADDLPFADKSFDVLLTSVTLVCIGPEEIEQSLIEICRVSRRWIVLAEPIEIDPRYATAQGREDPYPNTMYWIRDYAGLLEGRAALRLLTPLPAEWQLGHLNSIAVFEITQSERR